MCCFVASIALRALIVVLAGVSFVQSLFIFSIVAPNDAFQHAMSELLSRVLDKTPGVAQQAAQQLLAMALVPPPSGIVLSVMLFVLFLCVLVRETCVR